MSIERLPMGEIAPMMSAVGAVLDAWIKRMEQPPRDVGETDDAYRERVFGIRMVAFDRPVHVGDGWHAPPGTCPVWDRGGKR